MRIGTYLIFFIMLVDFQMLILLAQSLLSFVYLISDEEDTASVPCNLKGHQQPNISNGVAASYSQLRYTLVS